MPNARESASNSILNTSARNLSRGLRPGGNPVLIFAAVFLSKHSPVVLLTLLLVSASFAQTAPAPRTRPKTIPQTTTAPPNLPVTNPFTDDLKKYPGLTDEFSRLAEKLQSGVQFPPDRTQSRILPLLPPVDYYAAVANYGDAAHQALIIFQQELQQSNVLRDWWQHGALAAAGQKTEDSIEQFYQFSQFLGDEIVIAGDTTDKHRSLLLVAEVRKPGLKEFIGRVLAQLPPNPNLKVLSPQDLATANISPDVGQFVILVRPDFVIAAPSLETVRSFNRLLDSKSGGLESSPFGQKLAQQYQGGAGVLVAADVEKILRQLPQAAPQQQEMLNQTGFSDAKYLVWKTKTAPGHFAAEMELSFTGPRRGIAGWLASPAALNSLTFVSPKAVGVVSVMLKNFGEIFDDLRQLSTASNPNAFAMVDQMQMMMGVNLKDDLLSHLTGELTGEIDGVVDNQPQWRAVLGVSDPDRLEQSLEKLMAASGQRQTPLTENGVTYHSIVIPSPQNPAQLTYAFAEGYMVFASSRDSVAEAVRAHHSGDSLAKSEKFLSSIPPGRSPASSMFFYEDPVAAMAMHGSQLTPGMMGMFSPFKTSPVIMRAYGEPNAIRAVSNGTTTAAFPLLLGAAIAVPNLIHAKGAADGATAVSTVRAIITAQTSYAASYPAKGYARSLIMLGSDPHGNNSFSPEHAGLIDWNAGGASCNPVLCTKSGYRFILKTTCQQNSCDDFTVFALPLSSGAGTRNFCAGSDGVIHFNADPAPPAPLNAAQCRRWPPLQ